MGRKGLNVVEGFGARKRNGKAFKVKPLDMEFDAFSHKAAYIISGLPSTRKSSVGSSFDDFLKEEGIYEECVNMAVKAIIAEQMVSVMEEKKITKTELAKKMHTSRASIQRLLDPESDAVTLESLKRAANLIGKKIKLELV